MSPCHPRCPNAPEPPAAFHCHKCGEPIYPGDEYAKIEGVEYCEDCIYDDKEIHTNVTVYVSQCRECGHVDIGWERQEETEDILMEPLGPEPEDD